MKIPETIKIGEVEYSVKDTPALLELIQSARKEEKDKLYAQIQALEASKRTLEDEKNQNGKLSADKEAELKVLQDELVVAKNDKKKLEEEMKGDQGKDKSDKESKKDESKGMTADDIKKIVADALAESNKKVTEDVEGVRKELTQKEVADYRKELLAQNKGLLIEGLVPSNLGSKEDVNKAIETALLESKPYIRQEYEVDGKKKSMSIAEYETYQAEQKDKEPKPGTPNYQPQGGYPPKPDQGSGGDLTDKDLLSKLDTMSDDEYAKNASAILKEARSLKYEDE